MSEKIPTVKRSLLKRFSIFGVANLSGKLITFFTIILLSHYLSPLEYGLFTLFSFFVALVLPFTHLGIINGIQVAFFQLERPELKKYVLSCLLHPLLSFLMVSLLILLFAPSVSALTEIPIYWLYCIPLVAFLKVVPMAVSAIYRSMRKPLKYLIFNLSLGLVTLFFTVLFVAHIGIDWKGRVLAVLFGFLIFSMWGMVILKRKNFLGNFDRRHWKSSLKFGLPLVPFLIATVLIDLSDRYFIARMVSVEQVGIYHMGYKVGALISLLLNTFMHVWHPFIYKQLKSGKPKNFRRIASVIRKFAVFVFLAIVALQFLAPLFFKFLIAEEYQEGVRVVFWVALGYGFFSLYSLMVTFLLFAKRTVLLAVLSVVNVLLNMAFNYWLIGHFGAMGAAYATTLSFFAVLILATMAVVKLNPISWSALLTFKISNHLR